MTRLVLRFLLVVVAAAVPLSTARAQPAPPSKSQTAKSYVDAGLAAQNAGDYDTAIELYGKAYALVPHPVLLFNMGQAHRLAKREDKAVELYRKFLAEKPTGPEAQIARDLLAEIEKRKADEARKIEDARKADATRKADEARKAEEMRKADEARKAEEMRKADETRKTEDARKAEETRKADETRRAADERDRPARVRRYKRYAGIGTAGVGVVAVGVSVGFGLKARRLSSELSEMGAVYDLDTIHDGESAERISIISAIAGGALIAGGVVIYWLGREKGASSDHVAVTPWMSPEAAGLAFSGTLP
jgi:tetratricopeptide (TPR) repeat protein